MEIPSPLAGTLSEILVQNGDKINQGDDLCIIEITESEVPNKEEVETQAHLHQYTTRRQLLNAAVPQRPPLGA